MSKKYLLIGGHVVSKSDNDIHYISSKQLGELYRVNPQECIFIDHGTEDDIRGHDISKLITLRPRYDGNYQLKNGMPI